MSFEKLTLMMFSRDSPASEESSKILSKLLPSSFSFSPNSPDILLNKKLCSYQFLLDLFLELIKEFISIKLIWVIKTTNEENFNLFL